MEIIVEEPLFQKKRESLHRESKKNAITFITTQKNLEDGQSQISDCKYYTKTPAAIPKPKEDTQTKKRDQRSIKNFLLPRTTNLIEQEKEDMVLETLPLPKEEEDDDVQIIEPPRSIVPQKKTILSFFTKMDSVVECKKMEVPFKKTCPKIDPMQIETFLIDEVIEKGELSPLKRERISPNAERYELRPRKKAR